jgi:hypothetical protein
MAGFVIFAVKTRAAAAASAELVEAGVEVAVAVAVVVRVAVAAQGIAVGSSDASEVHQGPLEVASAFDHFGQAVARSY